MSTEQDLINKLLISKKIMEKHNEIGRGQSRDISHSISNSPMVEEYQPINANYNLPQEFLTESKPQLQSNQPVTQDKIMGSKLPDEIKRLMIEHPINQPANSMSGPSLSNELVEKASRLMNTKANGELINENKKIQNYERPTTNISADDIKNIVRETVTEVLKENGLLTESAKKTNEVFKFRVGQHLFEGKLTKVRKITE